MASKEVPPVNIVGNVTDTEYDEEAAEDEEDQGRIARGSWQGSYITQVDIDRLRRRRQIPEGVLTRVPPEGEIEPNAEEGEYVVFAAHFE